jgi:hypothetical protein
MKIVIGELFDSTDPIILVTTNSFIRKDGGLVMGRGAALQLKTLVPKIDYSFGKMIKYYSKHLGEYNVLLMNPYIDLGGYMSIFQHYGIFQVKYHYKDMADLELIKRSTDKLIEIMHKFPYNGLPISMNYPGIGFGQLFREEVYPIIKNLPDNVTIYERNENEVD